jgi:hypothetical protein
MLVYIDLIPVLMAGYALILLSRTRSFTTEVLLARVTAILLIICQLTWIQSYLNSFDIGTTIADRMWAVFNGCVMMMAILIARRNSK